MNAQPSAASFELEQGSTALKPQKATGRSKFRHHFYEKDELAEAIEGLFLTNDTFRARYDSFWEALGGGVPDFYTVKSKDQSGAGKYDVPALMHTAVQNMRVVQADPATGTLFSSRNGSIKVHNGQIQFVPEVVETGNKGKTVSRQMTYEDAFNAIILASTNKAMLPPNTLLIQGGSRSERVLYMRAVEAYNASVAPDLRFNLPKGIKAPAWDLPHFTPAGKFQAYMNRAVTPAPAPTHEENPEIPEDILAQAGVKPAEAEASKDSDAAAPASLTPDERHVYITTKLGAIEQYITGNEKEILKQPPVDKTGGTPTRNVYLIQMEGYPNDETYVAKIGGTLRVIFSKDDNNVGLVQHDDVYMQNDIDHPKHPLHKGLTTAAQLAKESQGVDLSNFNISASYNLPEGSYGPIANLVDITNGKNISAKAMQRVARLAKEFAGVDTSDLKISTTFTLPEGSYGPIKSFQDAAAPDARRNTARAIRAAAKLEENAPKPGAGSMG